MNQEIKQKLEQAAAYHQGSGLDFMVGAQTILENPQEWGLFTESEILESQKSLAEAYGFHNKKFNSALIEARREAAKYRQALERIAEYDFDTKRVSFHTIAKEALKNNEG